MKKQKSIVRTLLFFNLLTTISIVAVFLLLYIFFSSLELRREIIARRKALGISAANTLNVISDNSLNAVAKIEYDERLQTLLLQSVSPSADSDIKNQIRDVIDDHISLNSLFLGFSVVSEKNGQVFQSSAFTLGNAFLEEARSELGDFISCFYLSEAYPSYLFLAQNFYVSDASIPTEKDYEFYSISVLDKEIFFNGVFPATSLVDYKMNVRFRNNLLVNESSQTGEIFPCDNDFSVEICIPQSLMTLSPLNSPISYAGILFTVGLCYIIVNFINNKAFTNPIKELSGYCEKIPGELDRIPEEKIKGSELSEIATKINEIIAHLNRSRDDLIKQEQNLFNMKLEKQQLTLDMLYSQINSHFLYNTLSNIRGMALKHSDNDVADALHLLVKYFRYSTDQSNTSTIGDELDFLDVYLKIQTMRFGQNNFSYEIHCPDELRSRPILRMFLQPLAENCFAHGFKEKHTNCRIVISIEQTETLATKIVVADNGNGCDEYIQSAINNQTLVPKSGEGKVGIYNIRKRLQLYCPNDSLSIFSDKNGTAVTVLINTKTEKEA